MNWIEIMKEKVKCCVSAATTGSPELEMMTLYLGLKLQELEADYPDSMAVESTTCNSYLAKKYEEIQCGTLVTDCREFWEFMCKVEIERAYQESLVP